MYDAPGGDFSESIKATSQRQHDIKAQRGHGNYSRLLKGGGLSCKHLLGWKCGCFGVNYPMWKSLKLR